MKKLASAIGAFLLLSVIISGCSRPAYTSVPPAALKPVTIGLTYIPNIQFSPFYNAVETRAFAEEGISVSLRHHGSDEGLFSALNQGAEQIVIAGGDEAMVASSQGGEYVSVGTLYQQYPVVLIVPESSEIKSLADMRGKRLGLPGRYGENWYGLLAALKQANLTEKDVEIVEIGYTAAAALVGGKVDGVFGFVNNDLVQINLGGLAVRSIAIGTNDLPLVSASVITTKDYYQKHPDEIKAVVRAIQAGTALAVTSQEATLRHASTYIPGVSEAAIVKGAAATLKATGPIMTPPKGKPYLYQDEQKWDRMADFLKEHSLLADPAQGSWHVTNEFIK